jgi:hypothetical protein
MTSDLVVRVSVYARVLVSWFSASVWFYSWSRILDLVIWRTGEEHRVSSDGRPVRLQSFWWGRSEPVFCECELSLRLFLFRPGPNLLIKVYVPYLVKWSILGRVLCKAGCSWDAVVSGRFSDRRYSSFVEACIFVLWQWTRTKIFNYAFITIC